MQYFQSQRPVKRVVLPSNKSLWVEMYSTLTWKEEKEVGKARSNGTVPADSLLLGMIVDWNLEDENGIAPIDADHIDGLNRQDAVALVEAINGIVVASSEDASIKKASSKKSSQP